ncbi:MAG: hypothetical protein GY842_12560 [bacterium]|nr:hypothetical protein [bacterium]
MMNIPQSLVEQTLKGNCILFVGDGLFADNPSYPTDKVLAQELASRCRYQGSSLSLPRIAQLYEVRLDRQNLVEFICGFFDRPNAEAVAMYGRLAQLPIKTLVTTNIDPWLQQAYRNLKKSHLQIVREGEEDFYDTHTSFVVRFGCGSF